MGMIKCRLLRSPIQNFSKICKTVCGIYGNVRLWLIMDECGWKSELRYPVTYSEILPYRISTKSAKPFIGNMETSIYCVMYKQALLWISMAKYRNCRQNLVKSPITKDSERKLPLCHFNHHKPHMNYPRNELGPLSEKPIINPLSYGKA
jgi:hypothetical protein